VFPELFIPDKIFGLDPAVDDVSVMTGRFVMFIMVLMTLIFVVSMMFSMTDVRGIYDGLDDCDVHDYIDGF
jgi:hypothetical protein